MINVDILDVLNKAQLLDNNCGGIYGDLYMSKDGEGNITVTDTRPGSRHVVHHEHNSGEPLHVHIPASAARTFSLGQEVERMRINNDKA